MEDILASIRKIIAEDPPGSRDVPEPRPQTVAAAVSRPVMRDAEPAFQRSAVEPYLKQSPRQDPFPSYPAASVPEFAPTPIEPTAPAPRALSIDDQLLELLGDAPQPVGATKPIGLSTGPTADFIAKMTARPVKAQPVEIPAPVAANAAAKPETRPGFTVHRDRFVPSSPIEAAPSDPYDFNLGPSPFASRPAHLREDRVADETTVPIAPAYGLRDTPAGFGSLIPTRHFDDTRAAAHTYVTPPVVETTPVAVSAPEPAAAAHAETVMTAQSVVPDVDAVLASIEAADVAGPSTAPAVDETLPGHAASAAEDASPEVATPQDAVSPVDLQEAPVARPVHDEVIIVAEPAADVATPVLQAQYEAVNNRETPAVSAAGSPASSQAITSQAMTTNDYHAASYGHPLAERTMEDTVAELLRPMLKSWLAENMPKIVERALRKEIAERNLIEHKTAAE